MLEVFILIALCKRIDVLAYEKGKKPGTWKLYVVLAWILTEFTVGVIGGIFGLQIVVILLFAYPLAYLSFVLLRMRLKSMPDKEDDWVSQIGVEVDKPIN